MKVLFKSSLRVLQVPIIVLSATILGSKIIGYLLFCCQAGNYDHKSQDCCMGACKYYISAFFLGWGGGLTKNAYFAYVFGVGGLEAKCKCLLTKILLKSFVTAHMLSKVMRMHIWALQFVTFYYQL